MRWKPDSCQCIIHIEMPEKTLVKVIQKCQLHKDKSGKKLFDVISSHNKKFNTLEKISERNEEYKKIQKMGNPKYNLNKNTLKSKTA